MKSTLFFTLPLLYGAQAAASEAAFHPDLMRALRDVDRARGAEVYSRVRRIWSLWDRANPVHIEEALLAAEQSPALSKPARAYIGTLTALARARRGDIKAARLKFGRLGYVDRWLVVGPFDNEGKMGFAAPYPPELEFSQPIQLSRAFPGKERPVRFRVVPADFPFGWLNGGSLVRPETKGCIYATTFVSSTRPKPPKASAWVGAGGAFKLFWNGRLVLEDGAYRGHDFDRVATALELKAGVNLLSVKVCTEDSAPMLSVRLADAEGAPDPTLVASNELALSSAAAETAERVAKEKSFQTGLLATQGPQQALEQRVHTSQPTAQDFEEYARYLLETDGDDPSQHLARDFALRAAEKQPTVERLLLAGRLAEDRNQQARWIEQAEKQVSQPGHSRRDVLLARAMERRGSPNWREAVPYFDRVLELDPHNVMALRGRAEIYNMVGLPRTALSALTTAVERDPHCVNLLNMYGSQLRALGRATEAVEVESRYSALRFDDGGYLSAQIELGVARHDRATAERWVERLLESHPGSLWSLGVAARAYRALGQAERAAVTYKRALELAPEDVNTLRALAELQGQRGKSSEQLALLQEILRIRPQNREVREYVEHLEPQRPRVDEAYAWAPERFLHLRYAKPNRYSRRTLRDLTVSTVFESGLSSQFRQIVFQPLTEAAANSGRHYAFGYEADRQVVQLRGARVYRADGRIEEAVESGDGPSDDPSIAMYTSSRIFYVEFPRLEPGDVVELKYRVDDVTPRNEFGDYYGDVAYLQNLEPVANAEYLLIAPKSRTIYLDDTLPSLKREVHELGGQRVYRFFASEIPAINPEPAMPPLPELLGFVHVSTFKDWKDVGRWYWGLVKDQFDLDDETRRLAHKIAQGKSTDLAKVTAVYDWVTQNTRYVALEFGIYGYKPRRCVQTVARGWGDCKDKATVIVTLLKELGIPSTLVILRTQVKGDFRSKIASLAPFDHAIAYVPSLNLYLDGTAEYTGVSELPRMDLGAMAILVNQGNAELVRLPGSDPARNFVRREVHATLARSGEAKLEIEYTTAGYNAADWRGEYHAEATRRERISRDLAAEFPGFEPSPGTAGLSSSKLENPEEPVWVKVRGVAPGFARKEGQQLSMPVTSRFRLTPSYASLSERKQDVVIGAFTAMEDRFVMKLPSSARIISAPSNVSQSSRFGSYSVSVQIDKEQVTVQSRLSLTQARIAPGEYDEWRRFCQGADRAINPRLVIE